MSQNEQESSEAQHRAAYEAVWSRTVEVLTEAVRLRHPQGGPVDFPDFLASALASVAANAGGVYRLLEGRPGSWEADALGQLVYGTVGHAEESLFQHRTEPIVIHLNVHRLMANNAAGPDYLTPYERELNAYETRWHAMTDDELAAQPAGAEEAEIDAIDTRWAQRYATFAEAFTAAVQTTAAQIDSVSVPVRVEAETAPTGAGDTSPPHPEDVDYDDPHFDPLALWLWEAARRAVPLPDSDGDTPASGRDV